MRRWWVVACFASGCDHLLQLGTITPLPDAAPDAADAAADAACPANDKDGDCVADSVDNCPGIYNPDQGDGDKDGVGDVCDPHPTVGGDQLGAFYAFTSPDDLGAFQANPAWVPDTAAGAVHHASTTDVSLFQQTIMETGPDLTIEASFVFHAHGTAANRMGVWTDTPEAASQGQTCFVDAANTKGELRESVASATIYGNSQGLPLAAPADGDRFVVWLHRDARAGLLHCTIWVNDHPYMFSQDSASKPWTLNGYLGVTADATSADLRDVVLYHSP